MIGSTARLHGRMWMCWRNRCWRLLYNPLSLEGRGLGSTSSGVGCNRTLSPGLPLRGGEYVGWRNKRNRMTARIVWSRKDACFTNQSVFLCPQSARAAQPLTHSFPKTILREYDIRGEMGISLSADDAYALGRAFAATVGAERKSPSIVVGYDGRMSSPELEKALVEGMVDAGAQVLRVGLGPTPMLYYATYNLQADAGIMVTGSHNPPNHNGFKMVAVGHSVYGAAIQALGQRAASGDLPTAPGGHAREVAMEETYIARLAQVWKGGKELTVAWDPGNGAAGRVVERLVTRLPGTHHTINCEIDGQFPNHHPDPTVPKNLEQLIALVKKEKCDLGLAFDGDADRLGVVDAEGNIWWGDQLLLIYAEDVFKRIPNATVIADVKASQALFDGIAKMGGKPIMWKTGHSLIKTKMKETNAPLAGEMSGHLFFAEQYYGFDDGIYAGVRLLNILAQREETLADLRKTLAETYSTPEIRIACDDEKKFALVERIAQKARDKGLEFSDVDGVRAKNADGWWLLRASNTQAIVVARCESTTKEGLARLEAELGALLAEEGLKLESDASH